MRHAAVLAAALVVCATACHYRRDVNAPGIVDPLTPPPVARAALETPGDPGERFVVVSPGLVVGGGTQTGGVVGVLDLAAEVTLSFGEEAESHNPNALRDRLFVPPGWLIPRNGWGATLGWSFLRVLGRDLDGDGETDNDAATGPLYAELHRFGPVGGAGGGWSVDPATGDHGPELFGYLMFYHLRVRHMIDGETEVLLGVQLKWPLSWVTSR